MNVEIIICIYGAVCISMILFHCVTIIVKILQKKSFTKKDKNLSYEIESQIRLISSRNKVEKSHLKKLRKSLKRIGNLQLLEQILDRSLSENEDITTKYIDSLAPIFYYILLYYIKKDNIYTSYAVFFIGKYKLYDCTEKEKIQDILLNLLDEPSVFCREAVLKIFYQMGDVSLVLKALKRLDKSSIFHHSKLIHDGLLSFSGDIDALQKAIFEQLDDFKESMKVALLNYIRFSGKNWDEKIIELLKSPDQTDEVAFACILYFGKNFYEPAEKILQDFVKNEDELRWEYASISATALQKYPSYETQEILCKALNSRNWYVRSNSAQSLQKMWFTYPNLLSILDGKDKYAREIMCYWMDMNDAKEKVSV